MSDHQGTRMDVKDFRGSLSKAGFLKRGPRAKDLTR